MKISDRQEFGRVLSVALEVYFKPLPTGDALRLWERVLEPYSIDQVRLALSAHTSQSRFPPVPADVVERIGLQSDGRPGAEEAWATVLAAQDERKTVVWTDDVAAAVDIAKPVLDSGDLVAARMTFKETYNRIVSESRSASRPVRWIPCLGWDPTDRAYVLERAALSSNLLPYEITKALLPPQDDSGPFDVVKASENLTKVKDLLASMPTASDNVRAERERRLAADRENLRVAKASASDAVGKYQLSKKDA